MIVFISGILAGIISGMGIGGGVLLIPALVFFAGASQHTAQGANLLFFIPTALTALVIHIRNRHIDFRLALPVIITGLLGAYAGAGLAFYLSDPALKKYFGIFLLIMGIYEILRKPVKQASQ
jgi:uncharacterized membrane protein YfcA